MSISACHRIVGWACLTTILLLGGAPAGAQTDAPAAAAVTAAPTSDDPQLRALQTQLERLQAESEIRQQKLEAELADAKAQNERLKAAADVADAQWKSTLQPMTIEQERLTAESQIRQKKLEAELAASKAEVERLKAAADLAAAKQQTQLQPMTQEKTRLETEAALDKVKRDIDQAPVAAQLQTLTQQQQLREAQLAADLADMKARTQRLAAQTELANAEQAAQLAKIQHEQALVAAANQLEAEKLRTQTLAADAAKMREQSQMMVIQAKVQQRDTQQIWKDAVNDEVNYRKEPFVNGVLYISDRRITLDGPIISGVADYVCDRIDYFNNQSNESPIFLIIDNCPGGSVMEGYRIVKAIESSKAPVHVVVKSFAASMAAIITTLAPHSYAYPNAIILHHQMSAGTWGNMTDLEQEVQTLKEWERRLAEPVAAKMGITVAEFKKRMYDAKKSGDWDEFADRAVKLKWVNSIVTELRDESVRKKPTGEMPKPWWWFYFAKDEHGQTYVNLPPLAPMDAYMLYNPNHFYRVDGVIAK